MGKREAVRRRTFAEILETAGRMAEAEGWRAVTIRRIAAEIGYSTPVIYQHFPSKEAVLHTLLGQANGELAERMRAAVAGEPASRGPHLAATAYLEFARSRPSLYQLISGAPGTDVDASTRRAAAADVITFTRQLIGAWAAETAAEPPVSRTPATCCGARCTASRASGRSRTSASTAPCAWPTKR